MEPVTEYTNTLTGNLTGNLTGTLTDDAVVRSVCDGRIQHFDVLVNRYKNKIVNFIHKMIFDYDEAQSLAQDVFIKVFETIERYQAQDNFQAFVFTIAKNLTLNHIKKQKRVLFLSGFLSPNAEEKHFQVPESQLETLEKDQQQEMVTAALKELKENQRLALVLKVYLDFSYNKIAEITGWSVPKIETLISRGKTALKNKILLQQQLQEKPNRNVLTVREA